jgi:hypothetical protein
LRLKTEKEKCPIQIKLGIFISTTTTLCASGASVREDVQVQVLFPTRSCKGDSRQFSALAAQSRSSMRTNHEFSGCRRIPLGLRHNY